MNLPSGFVLYARKKPNVKRKYNAITDALIAQFSRKNISLSRATLNLKKSVKNAYIINKGEIFYFNMSNKYEYTESTTWKNVKSLNTKVALSAYLLTYSSSIHTSEAKNMLNIHIAKENKQQLRLKIAKDKKDKKVKEQAFKVQKEEQIRIASVKKLKKEKSDSLVKQKKEEEARLVRLNTKYIEPKLVKIKNQIKYFILEHTK